MTKMHGFHQRRLFHATFIRLVICCVGLIFVFPLAAQNLVPNPSFEVYTSCPSTGGLGGPMLCPPWVSPIGDCDYFHACATNPLYGVPDNITGFQQARTGAAYPGGHFYFNSNYREYLQAPLLQTLRAGHCYKVGYYINLANNSCGMNHAGVLLTPSPVSNPLGMTPQVDWSGSYFSDTASWVFVFGYVTAVGDESYITIGNFYTNAETSYDPDCSNPMLSYYFFEDVIVEEVMPEMIEVELEGPVAVCDSFVIETTLDPDVGNVFFTWSDGSHQSSLTVHETGEYTVTVQYGCNTDEATIEVTVYNPPAVNIGEDITLCNGDITTISLDPSLGDYAWQDGSSATEYVISEAGIYHVTLEDGCDITHDTLEVTLLDPPAPFSLGTDTFLCPGDDLQYMFDPDLGVFQWQDGSGNPSYIIDEEGTYALTITNMCGEYTDEIAVVEISPPFFDLGPDTSVLCMGDVIDIALPTDLGSYLWQDGDNSPFYTIIESGIFSVTITNECGVESDQMVVVEIAPPLIQFGPDVATCIGNTIILEGNSNTGMFLWQDGSTTTTYEVTIAGTYALSVTNACGFAADTITIGFNPPPIPPNLGADISLCPGESVTLDVSSPGAFYMWNDLSTADTLLITQDGIYYVDVFNSCGSFSDTIVVSLDNQGPVLNLPTDFLLCSGQSVILDAGVTGVSYLWSDGTMMSQLTVTSPGLYVLTVSNACGVDVDSVLISDGGAAPFVSLGKDTAICTGTSITISPAFSNVDTWLWHDGSMLDSIIAAMAGEIYVSAANGCGVAYDTMQIGLLPVTPILSLGMDTAICPGNSLTLTIDIPDVGILWPDGSMGSMYTVYDSAQVYATISNSCGSSVDTLQVSLLPAIPSLNLGPDQSICPGETIIVDPGLNGVNYLWQDGSTGSTISVTQEGLITLVITNQCGTSEDSLWINESTIGPQLDLGPDLFACEGETVTILSNISGVNYLWQDGSQQSNYVANVSGTYYLDVNNLCGMDSDTIVVSISGVAPQTDLGPDTLLCIGAELLLMSTSDSLWSVTWQDGSTGQTFLVENPGLYMLIETNACGTDTDSIRVTYLDPPSPIDLGPDTILCKDESILLTAPSTAFDILWQDGSSQPQLLADETDTYSLQLSNVCGTVEDSIHILVDDFILFVDLGPDTVLCDGDVIILDAVQLDVAGYLWNTGANTPSITINIPGVYAVEVFTPCVSLMEEIAVTADVDCKEEVKGEIFIPNVFSPNGDQVNDFFSMLTSPDVQLLSVDGSIFDRWGNLVYHSMQMPFTWDGMSMEKPVMPGVYVYMVTLTYQVAGKEIEDVLHGDVTVIR
jgi:gliding motility-associated-like protein